MAADVYKVGQHYQVFDTADNSPIGPIHKTREDAWDWWFEHVDEEMAKPGYGLNTAQKAVASAMLSNKRTVGATDKESSGDGEGQ